MFLELPVHYSTASAEYFASGAVALLHRLGVVDALCFGSEWSDLTVQFFQGFQIFQSQNVVRIF